MKLSFFSLSFFLFLQTTAQNVGIGTTNPVARLHVADSNVLFTGQPWFLPNPAGQPPISGGGSRVMWYADKAAFRAGAVSNTRWDKDSIGEYSFAAGLDAMAKGKWSAALGVNSYAHNWYGFTVGADNTALGVAGISMGFNNISRQTFGVAIGNNLVVKSVGETVIGSANDTSNTATGSVDPTDRIFQIGNGFGLTRSNAFTVLRNANTGIGVANPRYPLSFTADNGNKIGIYDDGNPGQVHFGIGMQYGQLMQLYTATAFDDIAFGYGNSASFTERVRIKGNGKVGINTSAPQAYLHVADSNVLFTGPSSVSGSTLYAPPATGAGTRMMWYPQKAAFRAGTVNGTQWDKDNIGVYSFAAGYNARAVGDASVAMGELATTLQGRSTAIGYVVNANGYASTAIGFGASANGNYSVSIGSNTAAIGGASISMGDNARSTGNLSTSIGYYTRARSDYSFVVGRYNDSTATNRAFEIGIGTAEGARKNAMTVLQTAHTGINTSTPLAMLHVADSSVLFNASGSASPSPGLPPVSNAGRRMMWYVDKAAFRTGYVGGDQWNKDNVGDYTFATGYETKASSIGSFASGINSTASSFTSVAMGYMNTASGVYSTAFGYTSTAQGYYSLAAGNTVQTTGSSSFAVGEGTIAKAVGGATTGRYNNNSDNPDAFTPVATDRIFQIGNGSDNNNRNNAVTVLRNGNVGIGNLAPIRPLSFPAVLGEKILLYPGAGGEVGIGVYGNELRLHTDYAFAKISFGYQDNAGNFTQTMWLNNNTSVLTVGGTAYASDERFKKQIKPLNNALQKLMALDGVEYYLRKDEFPKMQFSSQLQTGLLAQQVEKVMPSAVYDITEDGYKGVDYAKLVPLLIEGMKEQQKQIDELKSKIKSIEKK